MSSLSLTTGVSRPSSFVISASCRAPICASSRRPLRQHRSGWRAPSRTSRTWCGRTLSGAASSPVEAPLLRPRSRRLARCRLVRPRLKASLRASGTSARGGRRALVVSVVTFIDLWYVSQTTEAISSEQLAALKQRLVSSEAVTVEPVTVDVADATMKYPEDRFGRSLGPPNRRDRNCSSRPAGGSGLRDSLIRAG
jgi:hypothetical protein